ncbi:MAG: GNAT family N-acetyltransferase [Microlunatus sp.]
MSAMDVRRATAEDRDSIWPLARDLATSYDVNREAFIAIFDRLLLTTDALVLVAESESLIVGYLLAQQHHTFHANGPVVWVEEVMVSGAHRGLGAGRALMDAVEAWARELDAAYIALATRRAADFYAALGYEPSATYFKRRL